MTSSETFSYRVSHTTRYDYGGRIDLCHSLTRLQPRETPWQHLTSHGLSLEPNPENATQGTDFFGNATRHFTVQHMHNHLSVTADSSLQLDASDRPWDGDLPDLPWRDVAARLLALSGPDLREITAFRLPSRAAPALQGLRDYAAHSFLPATGFLEGCRHLMNRVFSEFAYVPGATDVATPVDEVLAGRKGVCQDFAHLMTGCLRSLGLAARYVSGYLETLPPPGKPKLQGADASHAWIETWMPGTGWIPFDPTNNLLPSRRHIVLAVGRDYFDVQPLHGVFLGSGAQTLSVSVDVERVGT